jgi:hypothetical protein
MIDDSFRPVRQPLNGAHISATLVVFFFILLPLPPPRLCLMPPPWLHPPLPRTDTDPIYRGPIRHGVRDVWIARMG